MAFTYQSTCDLARIPLNDEDKTRYPDDVLLAYVNHAVLTLLKRRPDLFVGKWGNLPDGQASLTDAFPLGAEYVQTVADYCTARAESSDDEFVNSDRAALFMQLFAGEAPL